MNTIVKNDSEERALILVCLAASPVFFVFYKFRLTNIGIHDDNWLLIPDLGATPHIPHGRSVWCSQVEKGLAHNLYVSVAIVDWVCYFALPA